MRNAVDWQVETLRITVFPVEIANVSPSKLWDKHMNEADPEIRIQPGNANQRHASHRNGNIFLIKTPRQIDWRYDLPMDSVTNENDLPIWGNLENELTAFLEFAKGFLQDPSILPVNRLAFGAVLIKSERDVQSVYSRLGDLLPRLDLDNVTDFFYGISRQRQSKVLNALNVNRLSRWHIATLERNISRLDPEEDIGKNPIERLFAARLELDINSSSDNVSPLHSDLLIGAFEEFVAMGLEIAKEGDIE